MPGESFDGTVQFEIDVCDDEFGKSHLTGYIPRITPRFERDELSQEVQFLLERNLVGWVTQYFNIQNREEYFRSTVTVSVQLGYYIDPFAPVGSKELDLGLKLMSWIWFADDILEEASQTGMSTEDISHEVDNLSKIMANHKLGSQLVAICDLFRPLYDSLQSVCKLYTEVVPDYANLSGTMLEYRKKYVDACLFIARCPSDNMVSQDMFFYWRCLSFYYDGTIMLHALIHGVTPPAEILKLPTVARILEILNSYGALLNDILGINKDIESNEDNILIYKFRANGAPLEVGVKQICGQLKEAIGEYKLLRHIILEENPLLEKFLDLMDCYMDGQMRIYIDSKRYNTTAEAVKLTRRRSLRPSF